MARLGERGSDQAPDPEPVTVVAAGLVRWHMDVRWDVVRGDGRRRRHMVVKAAALVPVDDEQHALPLRPGRRRLEQAGGERLPDLVILVLTLGGGEDLGGEQGDRGQPAPAAAAEGGPECVQGSV